MIVTLRPGHNSLSAGLAGDERGQGVRDESRRLPPAGPRNDVERQMVIWPAVTLLGFLLLMTMVIAMGASTTARYEREQRDGSPVPQGNGAAEPVGALAA